MSTLTLQVNNQLSVNIIPNQEHEFLIPTKDVAAGYGVSGTSIRSALFEHRDELLPDKHFVKASAVGISNIKHNATLWTKRGIVRLGFFIKSERAKQFRDWAEDLIIYAAETNVFKRIEALENKINQQMQPALAAPTYNELQNHMVAFFKKWLRSGDLKRIAENHSLSYVYVRTVRVNPARSQRVSQLIYQACILNQQNALGSQQLLN